MTLSSSRTPQSPGAALGTPPGALAPADVLRQALEVALGPQGAPATGVPGASYARTRRRTLTRRGLVWLGQTCNLRCYFCYSLDRIQDAQHPQHRFMTLEKAKSICSQLVREYGNNAVDLQGGEPTMFPGIVELVRHCREIGLHATLITNAQALSDRAFALRLREAGVRDFLVSLQGLGATYDRIVGREGAHDHQMRALRNLRELGIPFRFNCVLSRPALDQLPQIAELAVRTGALVVNLLAFNPYDDQMKGRSAEGVPRYEEVRGPLAAALDYLVAHGVEANARYLPMCVLEARHRPLAWNFQQLSYDHHENDFNSWRWTQRNPQRTRDLDLSRPTHLDEEYAPRVVRLWRSTRRRILRRLGRNRFARRDDAASHALYRADGRWRAARDLKYGLPQACGECDLRRICDGFHCDYATHFGTHEARPVHLGAVVDDPTHFIGEQDKLVQPHDQSWAL